MLGLCRTSSTVASVGFRRHAMSAQRGGGRVFSGGGGGGGGGGGASLGSKIASFGFRRHAMSAQRQRLFSGGGGGGGGASLGSKIASFPKENPFAFQLMVATGKTAAADVMVQIVVEKKKLSEIDWKRNFIFVAFGFGYLGGFQYWIMVTKYRQWFPTMDRFAKLSFAEKIKDTAGILDAMKMVAFDVIVHLPFLYFPSYYVCKEFVTSDSWNMLDWVKDGTTKYANNAKEDLTAMIKLWGPSDCVQFVLPVHIRMPFRHLVSFFWTAYVSFTRGGSEPEPQSEEEMNAQVENIKRRISAGEQPE